MRNSWLALSRALAFSFVAVGCVSVVGFHSQKSSAPRVTTGTIEGARMALGAHMGARPLECGTDHTDAGDDRPGNHCQRGSGGDTAPTGRGGRAEPKALRLQPPREVASPPERKGRRFASCRAHGPSPTARYAPGFAWQASPQLAVE